MKTILISEGHLWSAPLQVGGHQYAQQFLADGWRVIFVSAAINLRQLLTDRTADVAQRKQLWRSGGVPTPVGAGELIQYVPLTLVPFGMRLPAPLDRRRAAFVRPSLRRMLRRHGVDHVDLLWVHGAGDEYLVRSVPHDRLLLRVFDKYTGFSTYPHHLLAQLQRLTREADAVVCASSAVQNWLMQWRPDVHLIRNGVNPERFRCPDVAAPADLYAIARPRVMYVGAISEWMDWNLVRDLAIRFPSCQFVFIGPQVGGAGDAESVADLHNVHLLGRRPYDEVPAYLAHADVGIIPFVRSSLTDAISPIKVYEYLAAGLPVVATWWDELSKCGAPVHLASSPDEFAGMLTVALDEGNDTRQAYREYAAAQSWRSRYETVLNLIAPDAQQ